MTVEEVDECGGVFIPVPAQGVTRPVYAYGDDPRVKDAIFTCPVSAIPDRVWQLVDLWLTCRAMRALPYAGGALDQPYVVRRAWPLLEAAMAPIERQQSHTAQLAVATTMLSAIGIVRTRR